MAVSPDSSRVPCGRILFTAGGAASSTVFEGDEIAIGSRQEVTFTKRFLG